jgi:hypothetical protein
MANAVLPTAVGPTIIYTVLTKDNLLIFKSDCAISLY